MSNLDNIIRKIQEDAKAQESAILKDAEDKKDVFQNQRIADANNISNELKQRTDREVGSIRDNVVSSAELKARDRKLAAKQVVVDRVIESVKNNALSKVDELIVKIQSLESFSKIEGDKSSVIRPLQNIKVNIQNSNNIDFINQRVNNESLEKEFDNANEKILELLPTNGVEPLIKVRTRFDKIKPKNKYTLETEIDVEEFINELKSKMIEEINCGREIIL